MVRVAPFFLNHGVCAQKTTRIYLSHGIRISVELSFVLSQFTRVTDGETGRQTDGHLYRRKDRVAYMQRDNNVGSLNESTRSNIIQ